MSIHTGRLTHRALSAADWPALDRAAWEAAVRRPCFLGLGGRGAAWRPASRQAGQGAYGRLLMWLNTHGADLASEAPGERITRDRMRAYVSFLADGRSSVSVASCLGILCMVLVAMFPERDWSWLQVGQARLRQRAVPSRRKQETLVPASELLQLGLDLMRQAGDALDRPYDPVTDRIPRISAARDFRDGLLVALLASRPLRVKNLLQTEIGTHLRQSGARVTLQYTPSETKGHRAYSAIWPEILAPGLARYLAEIRPMLIGAVPRSRTGRAPGAHLWLAQGGTPLTEGALSKAIKKHTRRRFGHAITPHLFRACAATTVGNEIPAQVLDAAQLLGHATLGTTERSYIAADSSVALGQHQALIASMRAKARRPGRRT